MKRILPLALALATLAGCAQGPAATAETAASPETAAPTAAPQELTVYYQDAEGAAAVAVDAYAAAQGVTLRLAETAEAADLAVLDEEPAGDGWQNLAGDPLLSAAAARAGIEETTVTALPIGKSLYGYWADGDVLSALLGEGAADDLMNASWAEWSDFVGTLTAWLDEPAETALTLNGNAYTLPAEAAGAAGLTGVFDPAVTGVFDPAVTGETGPAAYTGVLLAAGDSWDSTTLTGPLNGLYSALTLEAGNLADDASTALFRRGYLCDLNAVLDADTAARLTPVPFKCQFDESDLSTEEYNLAGLTNYMTFAAPAWLAIPAGADAAGGKAAAAAILWLYTAESAEETLTQALGLVTPWGTASDATAQNARQIELVGAGILPGVSLDAATAAALDEAVGTLLFADGAPRTAWTTADRTAFANAAAAALAAAGADDAAADTADSGADAGAA